MLHIDTKTVLWKETDGIVTILRLSSGEFFEMNKVGSTIWKLLADGNSVDEIINKMTGIYAVSREKLAPDVSVFIAHMTAKGLLTS